MRRTGLRVGVAAAAGRLAWALLASGVGGCLSVKTEHEIKPIHITMDVNLRVDRELDSFFSDIDTP